ncbi:hypothetical protein [Nocardia neocaledoniensis]|uniref:hypothetical protein n=1 Tax=Nocardia neocaledoniensis TaxID=236511 RepID=UPI002453DD08|nr:hypothetical protein [Nocardia neocaledoniensis]
MEILWWGSHRRKAFSDEGIAARDRLADAARVGEWDVVLELAERHRGRPVQRRPAADRGREVPQGLIAAALNA